MNKRNLSAAKQPSDKSQKFLKKSAVFWFWAALLGQWAFVVYMAAHYGGLLAKNQAEGWSETTVIGHAPGDTFGNIMFGLHIFVAIILTGGGMLQLVPQLRKRSRRIHRWNGRIFMVTAILVSFGGFYLIWERGAVSALSTAISVSANGVLILVFSLLAWRYARKKQFATHRRFAIRALLAINGVWFFRVGTAAWVILNRGERVGIGKNFDGPFVHWWHWGSLIIPLLALELFFKAELSSSARMRFTIASLISVLTLIMLIGIIGAFVALWLPFII